MRARLSLIAFLALVMAGCAAAPTYEMPGAEPGPCVASAAGAGEAFIGLAVSGGGSRAALYGAGGMEALARLPAGPGGRSVLEQVTHISAVSGGSLASAYYVMKKPARDTAVLGQDGRLSDAYQAFFGEFRAAMALNYEGPMIRRQLLGFRGLNPAWTAVSLAEGLDEQHFGGATYADLAARTVRGDSPRLLVNTTFYNDGRRLVFGAVPAADLQFDFPARLADSPAGAGLTPQVQAALAERWRALGSIAPADIGIDVCRVRLSSTLVASMSYPPYIGPVTLRVGGQGPYWHVGDGGLADNSGVESLLMAALKDLQDRPKRRALIISLDSSFPFAVGGQALNTRPEAFTRGDEDFSRIPSIMEERANAYRAWFIRLGQGLQLLPPEDRLGFIHLRHTDAAWREDLGDVPASCRKEHADWRTPGQVRAHLAEIPTRLHLKSACDRELIVAAAAGVVAQNADRIREFLR